MVVMPVSVDLICGMALEIVSNAVGLAVGALSDIESLFKIFSKIDYSNANKMKVI